MSAKKLRKENAKHCFCILACGKEIGFLGRLTENPCVDGQVCSERQLNAV